MRAKSRVMLDDSMRSSGHVILRVLPLQTHPTCLCSKVIPNVPKLLAVAPVGSPAGSYVCNYCFYNFPVIPHYSVIYIFIVWSLLAHSSRMFVMCMWYPSGRVTSLPKDKMLMYCPQLNTNLGPGCWCCLEHIMVH